MASFSSVPDELLDLIGKACSPQEKSRLAQASRRLRKVVNPLLYKQNLRQGLGSAVFWAARHGRVDLLQHLFTFGFDWNDNSASRLRTVQTWIYPGSKITLPHYHIHFTPLHIAAKFGHDLAVRWLLYVARTPCLLCFTMLTVHV